MLYSVSFYEAQADFGNDMYYFSKQALIGVGGFIGMYLVSKLDYHLYGAFAFEIYVISMFLMALVQTPLGVTVNARDVGSDFPATFRCSLPRLQK